jgi:hypothetical protein
MHAANVYENFSTGEQAPQRAPTLKDQDEEMSMVIMSKLPILTFVIKITI